MSSIIRRSLYVDIRKLLKSRVYMTYQTLFNWSRRWQNGQNNSKIPYWKPDFIASIILSVILRFWISKIVIYQQISATILVDMDLFNVKLLKSDMSKRTLMDPLVHMKIEYIYEQSKQFKNTCYTFEGWCISLEGTKVVKWCLMLSQLSD